jgi:hypothetical protein
MLQVKVSYLLGSLRKGFKVRLTFKVRWVLGKVGKVVCKVGMILGNVRKVRG